MYTFSFVPNETKYLARIRFVVPLLDVGLPLVHYELRTLTWVDIRARILMSHNRGCNGGPVYIHLWTLFARGWGLAMASKTILTFVVVASFSPLVYDTCRRSGNLWAALVLSRLCPALVARVLASHTRLSGLYFS